MNKQLASGLSATQKTGNVEIPAIPAGVRLTTLDNGLTVILKEDHSAPVVSAQVWCMSGSIHEGPWLGAGLSHVLEHMLFKGTTTRGPSRIDQEIQDAGGYMNAYTSFDRTVYYINVPNTGARTAIDILCDISQHATLPEDELEKEKQVILREMDMNTDDPSRRSSRRLFETAYTRSPYRYTVIGYPAIFNDLQRKDILAYYHEKYAPNNLFFVIAGDISADAVEAQIREAFAASRTRPLPPAYLPEEPRQLASREIVEEAAVEMTHMHFSWHIPDIRHPDVPILDVLATLLGTGRSSRLFQQVREKAGLVHSVDAWTYSPGGQGLLGMSAVLDPIHYSAAHAAMLAEVDRMKDQPVTAAELTKAVKQFTASTLGSLKTMRGQAQDLGSCWMAAGDLNFSERYLAAVKRITPADLQRVAQHYLTTNNRTHYALAPNGSVSHAVAVTDTTVSHPIQRVQLENGLTVLIKENHRLPFVDFRAVFQGGLLAEPADKSGLTLLLAKMLLKGTTSRTSEQIATEIESLGGNIDSYSGNNSLGLNVEVLSSDFQAGLGLLADVTLNSVWPAQELELERQMQLASLKALKDQLLYTAMRTMRGAMFGPCGYGVDMNGTETSLAGIHEDDLRTMHRSLIAPNNCVLAIFGDVDPARTIDAVRQTFASWTRPASIPKACTHRTLSGCEHVEEKVDKKQAVVVIGFPGVNLHNPDRYALELIQEGCSDLGSRLFLRIREKLGLAYYVGAQNFMGLAPGFFAFYAGTAPEQSAQVEKELLNEAALLAKDGLAPEELQRAKAKIIGQKKIARQDLGSHAMTCALDELYGLGYNHADEEDALFEAVTPDQVRAVAAKYLQPNRYVVSWVRP